LQRGFDHRPKTVRNGVLGCSVDFLSEGNGLKAFDRTVEETERLGFVVVLGAQSRRSRDSVVEVDFEVHRFRKDGPVPLLNVVRLLRQVLFVGREGLEFEGGEFLRFDGEFETLLFEAFQVTVLTCTLANRGRLALCLLLRRLQWLERKGGQKEEKRTSSFIVTLRLSLRHPVPLHLLRQPRDVLVALLRVGFDGGDVLVVGVDGVLQAAKRISGVAAREVARRGRREGERWSVKEEEGERERDGRGEP
jgi:hypothetical protein